MPAANVFVPNAANVFVSEDVVTVISGDDVEPHSGTAVNTFRSTHGTMTTKQGVLTSALTEAWREELDFKIAMRRRKEPAGSSLEELEKKYGL